VSFVQPNKRDKPNNGFHTLEGFFSVLLRSRRRFVREERHVFLFKGEMNDQEYDPHADCRISDIKCRPMVGVHIDIEEVDYLAIP
jgi:hypothetical protein